METLRRAIDGAVVTPSDVGYEAARRVWNRMADARPAVVVRCASEDDIRRAIEFARTNGLEIAVRGGGHSVAGLSTTEGGLVVHLAGLRRVRVDPAAGTVAVGGGATWGEVDREAQGFALATTGGVISSTGVAGLTLGGGIGHLMRACGLSCDNVASYRLVTADGRIVVVDREREPDLDWALRGGGGNFGVVTEFTFRLHPIGPRVMAGYVVHPLDRVRDLLRRYRDLVRNVPDELSVQVLLSKGGGGTCAFVVCHAGPPGLAASDVDRVLSIGSPLVQGVRPMEYVALQASSDPTSPPGLLDYWKSHFLTGLPDEAVDAVVDAFAGKPVPSGGVPQGGIVIEHLEGAPGRVPPDGTAFPHRRAPFSLELISVWDEPAETDAHIAWTRSTWERLRPWSTGGVYANYVAAGNGAPTEAAAEAVFGPNLARLRRVKDVWDPDNVFDRNQNIVPAGAHERAG
ncbi:MAG TPA: FAD-binding oxidoreductase [Actinomycetota bacterium]